MATKKKRPLILRRLLDFLHIFFRNRRGALGVIIIAAFIIVAITAPLLTPYDTLGRDKTNPKKPLSGKFAAPLWLKNLPPALGGRPDLSENMFINGTLDMNVSASHPSLTVYESRTGAPTTGGAGSLAVKFRRQEGKTSYGEVRALVTKEFEFPYSGIPRTFVGDLVLFANGTTYEKSEPFYNATSKKVEYRIGTYLDVAVQVNVFFGLSEGTMWNIYPYNNPPRYYPPSGFSPDATGKVWIARQPQGWIYPRYGESVTSLMNSESGTLRADQGVFKGKDPLTTVFTEMPGKYVWSVEIIFKDDASSDKTVQTTLYIDNFNLELRGTSWGLLGTDQFGQDLFAQLVYGSRISLYIGILTAILGVSIGLVVGLAAGYLGRFVDETLMRFTDLLLVIPMLPLLIVLIYVLGARIENLIIIMGFLGWMGFSRLVRSQVLSLRERPFVEAAKAVGAGSRHIISKHILPNVMSLVYVNLATTVPGAITVEASLAWLGFIDPTRMSWGRMLYENQYTGAIANWWWVIPPGLCIAALAVSFILLGFSLDEILNPRLRRRR